MWVVCVFVVCTCECVRVPVCLCDYVLLLWMRAGRQRHACVVEPLLCLMTGGCKLHGFVKNCTCYRVSPCVCVMGCLVIVVQAIHTHLYPCAVVCVCVLVHLNPPACEFVMRWGVFLSHCVHSLHIGCDMMSWAAACPPPFNSHCVHSLHIGCDISTEMMSWAAACPPPFNSHCVHSLHIGCDISTEMMSWAAACPPPFNCRLHP